MSRYIQNIVVKSKLNAKTCLSNPWKNRKKTENGTTQKTTTKS